MCDDRPILSIIIAVYNSMAWGVLKECLDSILCQDVSENYELVCIDDGSTDDSLNLLKNYAEKYNNIIVISQTNHGAAYAKNVGLGSGHGRYLWIINSDDCIKNGSMECILATLKDTNPDVLKIRLKNIREKEFSFCKVLEKHVFESANTEKFIEPPHDDVTNIIRADLVKDNNLMFALDMKYHYDRLFGIQYYNLINQSNIYIINDVVYLRRQRQSSEMGKIASSKAAKEQYFKDSAFMAIEYHRFLKNGQISNPLFRRFVLDQKFFFVENAIVILPSTTLDKITEMKRLKDAGVYPYKFNYQSIYKAKGIILKILLFLRSLLRWELLYDLYYYCQRIRNVLKLKV